MKQFLLLVLPLCVSALCGCSHDMAQGSSQKSGPYMAGSAGAGSANIPVTVANPNGTTTTTTNTVYAPR